MKILSSHEHTRSAHVVGFTALAIACAIDVFSACRLVADISLNPETHFVHLRFCYYNSKLYAVTF